MRWLRKKPVGLPEIGTSEPFQSPPSLFVPGQHKGLIPIHFLRFELPEAILLNTLKRATVSGLET